MASMSSDRGEAYLRQQLAIQGALMLRRGLAEARVRRVLRGLEGAVRTELWRLMLLHEGHPA